MPKRQPNKRFKAIKARLVDVNQDALLADGFEDALMGICWRFGQPALAMYDRNKCVDILVKRDKMSVDDAREFFDFNVIGSWVGEHTPVFVEVIGG